MQEKSDYSDIALPALQRCIYNGITWECKDEDFSIAGHGVIDLQTNLSLCKEDVRYCEEKLEIEKSYKLPEWIGWVVGGAIGLVVGGAVVLGATLGD